MSCDVEGPAVTPVLNDVDAEATTSTSDGVELDRPAITDYVNKE